MLSLFFNVEVLLSGKVSDVAAYFQNHQRLETQWDTFR